LGGVVPGARRSPQFGAGAANSKSRAGGIGGGGKAGQALGKPSAHRHKRDETLETTLGKV